MSSGKQSAKPKKLLFQVLKVILVLIVVYFVYRQFSRQWSEVANYEWSLNWGWLLFSIILHLTAFLMLSRVWCLIIGAMGHKVRLIHAFKISYIADLGRYIPGKIWPIFGMAYLAKQLGIREEKAVASWGLAMLFNLPSAFAAGTLCILLSPEMRSSGLISFFGPGIYIAAVVIIIASVLMISMPNRMLFLANYLLLLLKREKIELKITVGTAFKIYIGYFLCWLCFGLAFWMFVRSITVGDDLPIIPTVGSFILAYQIGYLAFFAPGGIGIRELVISSVLSPYLGAVTAGIAVAARIWNLSVEILAFLIALLIRLRKKEGS